MRDVELQEKMFVYVNGTVIVWREDDGWVYRLVYDETVLRDDEHYVTWQAARSNAMQAYKAQTGFNLEVSHG